MPSMWAANWRTSQAGQSVGIAHWAGLSDRNTSAQRWYSVAARRVGLRAGLEVRDDVDVHQLVPRQVGDGEIEVVLGDGDQPGAGLGGQGLDRVRRAIEEGLPGLLEHRVVDGLLGGEVRVQRGLL